MAESTESRVTARLDELESRLAFQDDLIENLNEVITRQDRELARLVLQITDLSNRIRELAEAGVGGDPSGGHEVPPHY